MNGSCQTTMIDIKANSEIVIDRVIDMEGAIVKIPERVTILFKKGGCLKNGELVGSNTKIIGCNHSIFDNVSISGDWNVRYITTEMFCDLSRVNSLKDVVALASPNVDNVLTIMPGVYKVMVNFEHPKALIVPSNTEVLLNGTVELEPTNIGKYDIIALEGDNIFIHGSGNIIGDKFTHKSEKWEWGMGLSIMNSNNVRVTDIKVEQCWGDCIFIDGNSHNIFISNCTLNHGRRQGVSVISGDNIVIENCLITNVGGTAPQYAIDIEPVEDATVGNVIIRNVTVKDCVGGIMSWGSAKNAKIQDIHIYGCYVEGCKNLQKGVPYSFNGTDNLFLEECHSDIDIKPNLSKMVKVTIK